MTGYAEPMRTRRSAFLGGAAAAFAALSGSPTAAAETLRLELHGAFYSRQLQIVPGIDPQVFVADSSVAEGGIGLENIEHVAGLRALRLDGSDGNAPLFTAEGMHLGFTAPRWLGAHGTCTIESAGDATHVFIKAAGLIAFGMYSIFKRVSGASGDVDLPLDGTGKRNWFRAAPDGSLSTMLVSPQPLDPQGALFFIYHSDGKSHGMDMGTLGVSAHEHLIGPLGET